MNSLPGFLVQFNTDVMRLIQTRINLRNFICIKNANNNFVYLELPGEMRLQHRCPHEVTV